MEKEFKGKVLTLIAAARVLLEDIPKEIDPGTVEEVVGLSFCLLLEWLKVLELSEERLQVIKEESDGRCWKN